MFVAYVVVISLAPLVPLSGWQGYGPAGEFSYTGSMVYLRYNDPTFGNDKPHLFVDLGGYRVSLLEFSDQGSKVAGLSLYQNFSVRTRVVDGVLTAYYSSPSGLRVTKYVEPLDDGVRVVYSAAGGPNMTITLWRWYFETIEGYGLPVSRSLGPRAVVVFTVVDKGWRVVGEVRVEPAPDDVLISGEPGGLNKIALFFESAGTVVVEARARGFEAVGGASTISLRGSKYLYPVIAASLSGLYLVLRRRGGVGGG